MPSPRITHGTLHAHGATLLPDDLEEADWLLLDGGALADPDGSDPIGVLNHAFGQLAPILYLRPQLRVVATLGGHDPDHVISQLARRIGEGGNPEAPIAIVRGGDVLNQLEEFLAEGESLSHRETGERFVTLLKKPVAASIATTAEVARAAMTHGRVMLLADADLQLLEKAASGDRMAADEDLQLTIRYVAAHRFSCGLRANDGNATAEIEVIQTKWRQHLAAAGGELCEAQIDVYQSPSDAAQTVGVATSHHTGDQGQADARQSRRLLLQTLAKRQGGCVELHPDLEPRVRPVWGVWPTTLREDRVEWSVMIRTAAEWADR